MPQYDFVHRPIGVVVPAHRIYLIAAEATRTGDTTHVQVHVMPSLAIFSEEALRYRNDGPRELPKGATHEDKIKLGWTYDGSFIHHHLLICDPIDGHVEEVEEFFGHHPGTFQKTIVCWGDPTGDQARIDAAAAEARERALAGLG
ncbi:MAG: hypothetical protein IRY99_23850 [Isosphaeraceae bacterium]|nr:hypothetical protein [Isosphaeraceae bacterium]